MAEQNTGDKSEQATPQRLRKAREEGQVPRSRDLASALGLLLALKLIFWLAPAWLDALRGFFNPTSLCLIAVGHEQYAHTLQISQPENCAHWRLATALKPVKTSAKGFGLYSAAGYDELADSPVEMADFW